MPAPKRNEAQSTPPEEYLRWSAQSLRQEAISDYSATMKAADEASIAQVKSLTAQVETAFTTAQSIYRFSLAFLGLCFIICAVLVLWPGVRDYQRTVGTIGMPVILGLFLVLIYRSPLHIARKTMADVIKIQSIYLSYLRRINQLDMGLKQNYLSSEKPSPNLFEKNFEKMQKISDKALDDIGILMEEMD